MADKIQIDEVMSMESAYGLVKLCDEMIVPHFQRGLVWDDSSISLLLESLYFGTPCGSIILWTPKDALKQGKPLGSKPRYLIVDGQQRVRTLSNVFRGEEEESTNLDRHEDEGVSETVNGSPGEDSEKGIWCLNLGRAREFEEEFTGGKRFRLFRRAKDPRKSEKKLHGAPLQDRQALLPLRWFLDHPDEGISTLARKKKDAPVEKAVRAVLHNDAVKKKLRNMFKRPLFSVHRLNEDYSLEDVIGIYNRINSSGKRVESEEKAFANLVSICPEASEKLKKFFIAVHRSADWSRDDLLQRQKENLFGFKLFMRTFVQVLAYHAGRSLGSASFSFDSVNPETITEAKDNLPKMLDETKDILACLAGVLREELNCDDFRLLPETSSLWPVIQLLIRFPDLLNKGKNITGSLALRLLLADMQRRELLTLTNRVNTSQKVDDALALFETNRELTGARFERAIRSGIGNAQSLTNRNTLIFYWLLRERKAKDFSYDINLSAEKARKLKAQYGKTEPELCESVEAERQHIVPYKILKEVFNLEGRSRPGRHEVHDIGNLTYISQGLNGYETGLGSHPLKLDSEPKANLEAHLLRDPLRELLDGYNDVCSSADSNSPGRNFGKAKKYFLKFCKKRRELITDAFLSWEKKIHEGIGPVPIGIRPAERLIYRQIDDMIRSFGFPINVERALITLLEIQGMVKARKQDTDLSYGFRQKMSGKKKEQIVRVDLYQSPRRIEIKLSSPKLREWFRKVAPNIPVDEHHKVKLDEIKPEGIEEVVGMISEKLRRIAQGDSYD